MMLRAQFLLLTAFLESVSQAEMQENGMAPLEVNETIAAFSNPIPADRIGFDSKAAGATPGSLLSNASRYI